jgi:hypothetical protein
MCHRRHHHVPPPCSFFLLAYNFTTTKWIHDTDIVATYRQSGKYDNKYSVLEKLQETVHSARKLIVITNVLQPAPPEYIIIERKINLS